MAYLGNTPQTQGFTPAVDYFSGNGSTVTFTLTRPVAAAVQVEAVIDNVVQNPSTAYTVSGNAITFTSAPLSGTNNIYVRYTSLITTYNAISQSPSVIGDITASGGYLSTGSFNNSFLDGTIVDYVTGNGRVTVGPSDGFTIYNGGTSARTALTTWDSSGNVGIGTSSPSSFGALAVRKYVASSAGVSNVSAHFSDAVNSTLIVGHTGGLTNLVADQAMAFNYTNGSAMTQTGKFDTSGNFYMNSGYGSVATAYGCRAWVQYNGVSKTIYSSGNISSVTYVSTGVYTINFTNSMPDANYSTNASCSCTSGGTSLIVNICSSGATTTAPTTSAVQVNTFSRSAGSSTDSPYVSVAVFR